MVFSPNWGCYGLVRDNQGIVILVGGLVAMNFIFPLILGCDHHPN